MVSLSGSTLMALARLGREICTVSQQYHHRSVSALGPVGEQGDVQDCQSVALRARGLKGSCLNW